MKKRIAALLLSVVLCLSLAGTAFAVEGDSIGAEVVDGGVKITGTLTKGQIYPMATILDADGNQLMQFNIMPQHVDMLLKEGELNVKIPGLSAGDGITLSVPDPAGGEAMVVEVKPEAETFPVTVTEGEGTKLTVMNGETPVSSGDKVGAGTKLTVAVEALEDWKDAKVTVNGTELTGSTVTVTEATTIVSSATKAEPEKTAHKITIQAADHGKLTADKETAKEGEEVALTAEPDSGYRLLNVTVKGASGAEITSSRTGFTMPDEDVTVTPTFVRSSSGGGSGGGGGGGGGSTSYAVKVAKTEHGKVTVRPDSAVKDQKVTITVTPDKGYALDTLTVTDANGKEVTLTKVNDTTYTFLMPGTAVTVEAAFAAIPGKEDQRPSFSDVADKNYTFYADIMWAAEKGYMNGYSDGTFRPNNNTTRQALWMVLARIDGANPSDMTAARAWAMNSGVSDGTNPGAAMSRQQMVTMLYRYAQLKGYKTSGGTSISAYPDAANVASYAKDALSWAIGNGIVNGTSDGKLNPTGTASRAHFAAFLHRFAGIAGL